MKKLLFFLALTAGAAAQAAGLDDIIVYPNPVRFPQDTTITFGNVAAPADVEIFTADGRRVRQLQLIPGDAQYALTNDSGQQLASGIYVYLLTDGEGHSRTGKFAVLR